jgi:zinc protease
MMRRFAMILGVLLVAALSGAARPAAAVEVKRVVSPAGIEAWLVEDHTNPLLSMSYAFKGGAVTDPDGKAGTAELLSGLLDEGAGELTSEQFQRRMEDKAIKLSFNAAHDAFGGGLKTLTKHRDEAFGLLKLALTQPRFDAEPVSRVRAQVQANLARQLRDPETVASRAWMAAVFAGHPYARPVDGSPETVNAITVDDLRGFVRDRFARDNLLIGVCGDITPDELGRLLDVAFAGLPAKSKPLTAPKVEPQAGGKVFVARMDVPQSVVMFGEAGLSRRDPDWYAALVMNYILGGGGFASRLTEEVREKRGLAYGISTSLDPMDLSALVVGGTATRNAKVGETVGIIRDVWEQMRQNGLSPETLDNAKTYLIGSFPLQLTNTGSIAGVLVAMQRDQLGIDYLDRRSSLLGAVTAADVHRVAQRLLETGKLTFVVVGDPQGLQGAIPLTRQAAAK